MARSRHFRGAHTRERGKIDKKSTGDPPALELLRGDRLNFIGIKVCNCSSHALRLAEPCTHYASLLGTMKKSYLTWNKLSGSKTTKNARILLHASLNHDVVTASQLLNASMILSTPLCDHYGKVSSTAALEIGGRDHRCTPTYCTRHHYRVGTLWAGHPLHPASASLAWPLLGLIFLVSQGGLLLGMGWRISSDRESWQGWFP